MIDSYNRKIDYLRISLTDRCNLRCRYCMPQGGVKSVPHADILRLEEIEKIVRIMAGLGVKKVRLTGGEPLIRKNVSDLAASIASVPGIETLSMTTNGILLKDMAADLYASGVKSINISLDTLDEKTFEDLTGVPALKNVLAGIDAALLAGMDVKLNCVPIKGINDKELSGIVRFGMEKGITVRFIELMPLGCGAQFTGVPSDEIKEMLNAELGPLEAAGEDNSASPAVYYNIAGAQVGFISPISHAFCENCNRIRLTAEGYLKLCLQYGCGIDLRALLRSGASGDEIALYIKEAVLAKPAAHTFGSNDKSDVRKMYQIGG
ncbi:MAG: GTP 3',8-cyclase MoaA [Lachnospiraceae bacterium]|nr:GTP 3',8-cyclase MoaA [Lachnospiraceae bacterium]